MRDGQPIAEPEPLLVVTATVTVVDDGQGGADAEVAVEYEGNAALCEKLLEHNEMLQASGLRFRNTVLVAIGPALGAAKRRRAERA